MLQESQTLTELRDTVDQASAQLRSIDGELEELTAALRQLEADKAAAIDAQPRLAKRRVKSAAAVRALESQLMTEDERQARVREEMTSLQARLETLQYEITSVLAPAEKVAAAEYARLKGELSRTDARMEALYEKQVSVYCVPDHLWSSMHEEYLYAVCRIVGNNSRASGNEMCTSNPCLPV